MKVIVVMMMGMLLMGSAMFIGLMRTVSANVSELQILGDNFVNSPSASSVNFYGEPTYGHYERSAQRSSPTATDYTRQGQSSDIYQDTGTPPTGGCYHWGYDSSPESEGWPTQSFPLNNVTINEVYVIAVIDSWYVRYFKLQYILNVSTMTIPLEDSYDGQSEWLYHYGYEGWVEYQWRITDFEDWTPAMLKSSYFGIGLYTYGYFSPMDPLLVDYLGFQYNWTWESGYEPPGEDGNAWIFSGSTFIGAVGFIGFVGLIATPAIGIYLGRQTDDKIVLFTKMFGMMAAFFVMFLAAIG